MIEKYYEKVIVLVFRVSVISTLNILFFFILTPNFYPQ